MGYIIKSSNDERRTSQKKPFKGKHSHKCYVTGNSKRKDYCCSFANHWRHLFDVLAKITGNLLNSLIVFVTFFLFFSRKFSSLF